MSTYLTIIAVILFHTHTFNVIQYIYIIHIHVQTKHTACNEEGKFENLFECTRCVHTQATNRSAAKKKFTILKNSAEQGVVVT